MRKPVVTEYTVLEAYAAIDLAKLVRAHMDDGWQPSGPAMPAGTPSMGRVLIFQTMIKHNHPMAE